MTQPARRSKATWFFLALVLGSSGWALSRAIRPPSPAASTSSATSTAAPATTSASAAASTSSAPSTSTSAVASGGPSAAASPGDLFPPDARVVDKAAQPLLGGLALGEELSPGVRVVGILVRDGKIEVHLQRGESMGMTLWVSRKQPGRRAAYETESYGVTYGNVHPKGASAPEAGALAQVLGIRVGANESKVAAPPGL